MSNRQYCAFCETIISCTNSPELVDGLMTPRDASSCAIAYYMSVSKKDRLDETLGRGQFVNLKHPHDLHLISSLSIPLLAYIQS